jgi:hypothetical protein
MNVINVILNLFQDPQSRTEARGQSIHLSYGKGFYITRAGWSPLPSVNVTLMSSFRIYNFRVGRFLLQSPGLFKIFECSGMEWNPDV